MIEAIGKRELILLKSSGKSLVATCHWPHDTRLNREQSPMGILFLNALSVPRSALGDSAVYWADSFASFGYPAFRLDMSGLGDSEGDMPDDLVAFINSGGYGELLRNVLDELVDRYNLSGVTVIGLCAGAVSAIYAAASSPKCRGLVLMDPYFYSSSTTRSAARDNLSNWASQNNLGRVLQKIYSRMKEIRLRLQKKVLPENANRSLLDSWKKIVAKGTSVLVLCAPNAKPRVGEFNYLSYILTLAGSRIKVTVQFIEGTDHSFANRKGRKAVREHTEQWLCAHFPFVQRENPAEALHAH
jgi:pimeloyl-ACP methyl ester carboxylesterase